MTKVVDAQGSASPWYATIAADLEQVERVLAETLAAPQPGISRLTQHLEQYRGKRLRPMLLLLTARACGRVTRAHHVLGAVVEMIHTATLVHDDVLDGADTRRHVRTVNSLWGNQASVLLGDYLFTRAFHLTATLGDAQACEIIGEATNRVCEGELHQICQRGNLDLTAEQYFDIIDAKTAELTACCCRLGALYAGAGENTVAALTRYGRALGTAFQIADDVLDLVGQEKTVGKSLGTDVEQQKLTLPVIDLLTRAPAEVQAEVRHVLQNGHTNKRMHLLRYLEETASIPRSKRRAEAFARQAQQELACLPPSTSRDILHQVVERAIDRDH